MAFSQGRGFQSSAGTIVYNEQSDTISIFSLYNIYGNGSWNSTTKSLFYTKAWLLSPFEVHRSERSIKVTDAN